MQGGKNIVTLQYIILGQKMKEGIARFFGAAAPGWRAEC